MTRRVLIALITIAVCGLLLAANAPTNPPAATPVNAMEDGEPFQAIELERILRKCAACHGKNLMGKQKKTKKTPAIAGLPKSKILKTLSRKIPKPMKAVAKALTSEEKSAVANHISKLAKSAQ